MRRRTLIRTGTLATAGLAVGGAGWLVTGRLPVLAWVVRRHLPDARLPDAELRRFHDELWPLLGRELGPARIQLLRRPARFAKRHRVAMEDAERRILTSFLMGSTYFSLADQTGVPVKWVGLPTACANPFRRV